MIRVMLMDFKLESNLRNEVEKGVGVEVKTDTNGPDSSPLSSVPSDVSVEKQDGGEENGDAFNASLGMPVRVEPESQSPTSSTSTSTPKYFSDSESYPESPLESPILQRTTRRLIGNHGAREHGHHYHHQYQRPCRLRPALQRTNSNPPKTDPDTDTDTDSDLESASLRESPISLQAEIRARRNYHKYRRLRFPAWGKWIREMRAHRIRQALQKPSLATPMIDPESDSDSDLESNSLPESPIALRVERRAQQGWEKFRFLRFPARGNGNCVDGRRGNGIENMAQMGVRRSRRLAAAATAGLFGELEALF